MKVSNKNYKTNYKGYEITFAGGVYICESLFGSHTCKSLSEIKSKIRQQINHK